METTTVRVWEDIPSKNIEAMQEAFKLLGVVAEIESGTYNVKELILKKDDHEIRFSSGFTIAKRLPETKQMYVLEGKVFSFTIREIHATHDAAYERKKYYAGHDLDIEAQDVSIKDIAESVKRRIEGETPNLNEELPF